MLSEAIAPLLWSSPTAFSRLLRSSYVQRLKAYGGRVAHLSNGSSLLTLLVRALCVEGLQWLDPGGLAPSRPGDREGGPVRLLKLSKELFDEACIAHPVSRMFEKRHRGLPHFDHCTTH